MHIANVTASDLYVTTRMDYDGGQNVPITNKIIVPYQGALEIIDQPLVANPSDNLRFASYAGIGTNPAGVANGLDCWITYKQDDATDYIGIGSNITATTDQTVFTSVTNPSVINTIVLANYSDTVDVDASISIFSGGSVRVGYLAYNLTIPQNSNVQILPRQKRIEATDTIVATASVANALTVNVAGKYIT